MSPPPLTYPSYTAPSAASSGPMAETQNFPPPPYLDYSHTRRLPQPIQLPPLTIPQNASRPEMQQQPALPAIQTVPVGPPRHQQSRSYSGAPLEKILSPHPYTPPRSDAAYSPRSPPRSAVDTRPPPFPPARSINPNPTYDEQRNQEQRFQEYRAPEQRTQERQPEHRHHRSEGSYSSPVEPQRYTYSNLPSPAPSYVPPYHSGNSQYRQGIPPPPAGVVSSYTSSPYTEQAPAPQPPRVATVPGPQVPQQDRGDLIYELKVRQQPIAARACGFGERDRRVIDPPPIIQLLVTDPKTGQVDLDELRYSLNVVHCTLWNADGSHEETALVQPDRRTTRRLMGQLVASPSVAKDEHDVEGCFFCFPDLSCRTHGKYRLRFILMRIDPMNLHVGGFSPILTEVLSDVFTVYTAKDFPGMRPSSALTRALKLQGCNIQVKKGNEKALTRKRSGVSSEGDEEEEAKKKRARKD
ncbi:hypothetical protein EJ08DRAFT_369620 [Tothia fuscella]|uniref:Velvet domain-containing protein n=1 Tax=Tothia fuscella TaxID=1048955 RepID=A0A9P4NLU7_9PEZI|nr:hypothetical protein EJ08DRAFT_369620 [Tothia fuscella]